MKKISVSFAVVMAVVLAVTACLAADLVSSGASKWKVYNLTPSGQTLSSKVVTSKTGVVSFVFTTTPSTNYLLTTPDNPDFTGKTITPAYTINDTPTFSYDTTNNPCGTPATARVYFQAKATGPFNPSNFWWSHAGSAVLGGGNSTLSADTGNLADWSDFFGKFANSDAAHTAAFNAAVANVGFVGLSFGGGCFFSNGVGATPDDTSMSLTSFDVN